MSTEESKKVDKELSITRRTALKAAGWAVPVIVAVGLGGSTFVFASGGGRGGKGNDNNQGDNDNQ
jgi:hypothetical protein